MEIPKEFYTPGTLYTLTGSSTAVWIITSVIGYVIEPKKVNFAEATIRNCTFINTDVTRINLSGAVLIDVEFKGETRTDDNPPQALRSLLGLTAGVPDEVQTEGSGETDKYVDAALGEKKGLSLLCRTNDEGARCSAHQARGFGKAHWTRARPPHPAMLITALSGFVEGSVAGIAS
jgi:hypothetical protein